MPAGIANLMSEHAVVRVSIKRSARDGDLLVVRKLEAGKPLPPGRTEAYLVLSDPADDPFGQSGGKS
jgi:hypothetical protein